LAINLTPNIAPDIYFKNRTFPATSCEKNAPVNQIYIGSLAPQLINPIINSVNLSIFFTL